jgi:prepilin-type N-terminal cleavage/methylation domain-containing protein
MNLKQSTLSCSKGFTLPELLISLSITGFVSAMALTIALSSHDTFETDQNRTEVNQNLRSGMDLLGSNVRQAGERLPKDIPAIQVINGADGAPDTLVLRKNLLDHVLPVCKSINAGSSADAVFVAKKKVSGPVPQGCGVVPDDDGDGWPDNLQAWREYRIANGGEIMAYIYNPTTLNGEFFIYDAEDNATFHLHKENDENWEYDYDIADGSRIYILEQDLFRVNDNLLQLVINGRTDSALNLIDHLVDLQARVFLKNGTVQDSLGVGDSWYDLDVVEITLVGQITFDGRKMTRTVSSRFFPRNVLSN